MLSERTSLTPAEPLVAADAVIRIAIVHGHTNEIEAANMAYTALVQLVDSFFLVVGPVRVPVPNLGQSTANDVSALTNFICPVRHRNFVPKIESIHVNTVFTVSNPPLLESWPQKIVLDPQVQPRHPSSVFDTNTNLCRYGVTC